MIGAALPAASILAAETEEVEGWRLLIPAGYDILWSAVVLVIIGPAVGLVVRLPCRCTAGRRVPRVGVATGIDAGPGLGARGR